jgi:hypothetical protein
VTGIAAATRPRVERLALTLSADAMALTAIAVLFAALTAVTWGTWGDPGRDTGYDLVAGARVAHGDLPYSDFVYFYGPLAPLVLGLAGWLGGSILSAAVVLGIVLAAAIVAATYALARTQAGPLASALAAALVAAIAFSPTNLSFVLPHTESAPLGVLATLCFLLGLARYAAHGQRSALVAAGVFAGLVALTRPEFELAVIVAGAAWLLLRARSGQPVRGEAARLVLPAALVPAAVYGAFLTQVSLHSLLWDNLYPRDVLRAGGNHLLKAQAPLTVHSFVKVGAYLVLYAVGIATLLVLARLVSRLPRRAGLGVVAAIVALAAAVALVKSEALRTGLEYAIGWVPAGAVIALGVVAVRAFRRRTLDARDQALLAALAVLVVLAAKVYDGFYFLAPRAQPAVYVAPFVALLLVRLHFGELARSRAAVAAGALWLAFLAVACVGLTVKDAHARSAAVTGAGGTIHVTPAEAPLYRRALAAIETRTRPGEPILIAPQLTMLYTLSNRTNPLPQISLLAGALATPQAERQAITRLDRAGVRLIITDRHPLTEYRQTSFGGSFDRVLAGWIRSTFVHVETLQGGGSVSHTLDIWLRRV